MSAKSSSLFADLQQMETAEVEAMYETALAQSLPQKANFLSCIRRKKFIRKPSNSP